ncbi:MAG: hypothetical protein PVH82_00480 [Desulfobacteraceae bacterium]|jgi:hypothetical protein
MSEWIPFKEGDYIVEQAFFLAPDHSAVLLDEAVIRVFEDRRGERQMNGSCRVINALLVKLLDDHNEIDLVLDLGAEFKYLLRDPILKGGKVFSPDVKSTLQFLPKEPWTQIQEREYEDLHARLNFLS